MSKRGILDTCYLIGHWRQSRGRLPMEDVTVNMVASWAKRLIDIHETDAIVTPVALEMLCGVMSKHELDLTRAIYSMNLIALIEVIFEMLKIGWKRSVWRPEFLAIPPRAIWGTA